MSEMLLVIQTPNAGKRKHMFLVSVAEPLSDLLAKLTDVAFTKQFEHGPNGAAYLFAYGINYLGVQQREVTQRSTGRGGLLTAVLAGIAADRLPDDVRQKLLEKLRFLLSREDELIKGIDWKKSRERLWAFSEELSSWCNEHCRGLPAAPFADGPPKAEGGTQQEEAKQPAATAKGSPSRSWKIPVLVGLAVLAVAVGVVYLVSSNQKTGPRNGPPDKLDPANQTDAQIDQWEKKFKDRPPHTAKEIEAFRTELKELQARAVGMAQNDRIVQMFHQLGVLEDIWRDDWKRKTESFILEVRKKINSATSVRELREQRRQLLSPTPTQLVAALNRSKELQKIQQDGLSEIKKCLEKKQVEEWRADFQHLLARQHFTLAAAMLREEPPSPDTEKIARVLFREFAMKAVREWLDWAVAVEDFAEIRKDLKRLFQNPDVRERELVTQKEEADALAQLTAREDRWLYERFRNADGRERMVQATAYLDSEERRSMKVVVERWQKNRLFRNPLGLTLKTADLGGEQPQTLTMWLIPQKTGIRTEQKKWNLATKAFDPDDSLVVDLAGEIEWTVELKVSFSLSSGGTANYSSYLSLKRSKLPEERKVELARKTGMGPETIQLLLGLFDPVADIPEWRPFREPQS